MKLFKVFIKDWLSSYWLWISIILNIIGVLDISGIILGTTPVMKYIFLVLSILCFILASYKLYSSVAIEYPDILLKHHVDLKFNDCCPFIEVKQNHKKAHLKYKTKIIDDNRLMVDDCYGNYVGISLYSKIQLENCSNEEIIVNQPVVNLVGVNGVTDNFFIDRLQVSIKKVKFTDERYNDLFEGLTMKKQHIFRFPHTVNKKEGCLIFLYLEIGLCSFDNHSFEELLQWIRNISLKIDIPIIRDNNKVTNSYTVKYNFKRDMIKNMINEKIKSDMELEDIFNETIKEKSK